VGRRSSTSSSRCTTSSLPILEIISPAGFEHVFDDMAGRSGSAEDDEARYGVEVDLAGIQRLIDGYGLQFSFVL
jgi:hypothetical protein